MYYKKLGITGEDVLNETDMEKVKEWKRVVEEDLSGFRVKTSCYKQLSPKQKQYEALLVQFKYLIQRRIGEYCLELREKGLWKKSKDRKQERIFSVAFQQAAKEHLPKETYDMLVELANQKVSENKENI